MLYAILYDKNGKVRSRAQCAGYSRTEQGQLLYLELVTVIGDFNRYRANFFQNRRTTQLVATDIKLYNDEDGRSEYVKNVPKTKYHQGAQGNHHYLLHEGFDPLHLDYLFGGDAHTPSPWFCAAMQKFVEAPFLSRWATELWKVAVDDEELIKKQPGFDVDVWRLIKHHQAWQELIVSLRSQGKLVTEYDHQMVISMPAPTTKLPPTNGHRPPIQVQVENILKAHGKFDEFLTANNFWLRLEHESNIFMPLVIEKIPGIGLNGNIGVSVAHYGEQNGDAMRDPEIVFDWTTWNPVMFQNDYMGVYQDFQEHPTEAQGAAEFANGLWASNLKEQGYEKAKVTSD